MARRDLTWLGVLVAGVFVTACSMPGDGPPEIDPESRRGLDQGEVVGFVGEYGGHVWQGLPYAQPPIGERRWRAPVPPEGWSGTREANEPGNPCPQLGTPIGGVRSVDAGEYAGSEDCLYLNVHAPRMAADEVPTGDRALPVMVWIHGGGNVVGLGDIYNGGRLAQAQDVVVVTINYRLGPLGWFRHAALRSGDATAAERSGNFAILDQVRALAWVRDNIAAFGGDPDNVTVFGESAGGRNAFMLLLSSLAEGLFDKAIVQSGGTATMPPAEAERFEDGHKHSSNEIVADLLVADGKADDRAAAKAWLREAPQQAVVAYLRSLSAARLIRAYAPEREGGLSDVPQVFADGTVLPAGDPLELLAARDGHNDVPVMVGSNRDETKLFLYVDPAWVKKILWLIPRMREPDLYHAVAEYTSRQWKASGVDAPAAALASAGGAPVYAYRFDWDEEPTVLGADLSEMLGAAHGLEIPFVFGHWVLGEAGDQLFTEDNRPGRESLSADMRNYWASFARDGDPNGPDLPDWRPWTAERPGYQVLDTEADAGVHHADETRRVDALLARIDDDARLQTPRARCVVYRAMASMFDRSFKREDYEALTQCEDFPYEGYPWRE